MLVIHENDCGYVTTEYADCDCSAPTAEQLRELVESALDLRVALWGTVQKSEGVHQAGRRLDAALEPFREKK